MVVYITDVWYIDYDLVCKQSCGIHLDCDLGVPDEGIASSFRILLATPCGNWMASVLELDH